MIQRNKLRVACAYQGGKQRVATQIAQTLIAAAPAPDTQFYDLCCGSGAISIELVNQGVHPSRITMLDLSPWAAFWQAIGSGSFQMEVFRGLLDAIPADKSKVKEHMTRLAAKPVGLFEAETYPILQACSFGGKQIWQRDGHWENAFFRDYWTPTPTSVRRSPANPMQPSPSELHARVVALVNGMHGVHCVRADISTIIETPILENTILYIDPPYVDSTGYGYTFDVESFAIALRHYVDAPLFISEGKRISDNATLLTFGGAKGGISGTKKGKHEEWLNRFN